MSLANPVTSAIVNAGAEPLKTMVLGTAHEVTVRVIGQATLGQKLGYFLIGAVGVALPVGLLSFIKGYEQGVREENTRLKKFDSRGEEDRRSRNTGTSN